MNDKVAIVTGAGSGIGRSISLHLAGADYCLTLAGRDAAKLVATAAHLAADRVQIFAADVAAPGTAPRIIDACRQRFGRLDLLVNNAGRAERQPIARVSRSAFEALFALNVFGPAELVARAWPNFLEQRSGMVVNISSLAAHDPFAGYFAYAATKAALESLSRSIAVEGAEHGIRAYNLALGTVDTMLVTNLFTEAEIPLAKRRSPDEVAKLVLQCVNGDVAMKNGETIIVPNL